MEIAVIGAGSWGTALAIHLQGLRHQVRLWARRPELCTEINACGENRAYAPGYPIAEGMLVTADLGRAVAGSEVLLLAVPSHTMADIAARLCEHLTADMCLVSATKGIEVGTLRRMSQVLKETLPHTGIPVLALSGPSFAQEVLRGDPTAIALACEEDGGMGKGIQRAFSGRNIRLYLNPDMIGTELGGAVKNVIAIAAGVLHGLGHGNNTVAALVTRGLAEVRRLALAAGGRSETLAGLAGLGDLVLTCTGDLSRNRKVGIELGRGRTLEDILSRMSSVAEGINTTRSARELARRLNVEMPIVEQTHALLYEGVSARDAIQRLMERELKQEEWR